MFYPFVPSLNQNNIFTGTNIFNGEVELNEGGALAGVFTGNPTFSSNPSFTGLPTVGNLNGFYFVDGSKYPTLASAVTAANTAGGGTIYAVTPEIFLTDPFSGLGQDAPNIRVIFGPGVWKTKVPIAVPAAVQFIGAGRSLTTIQATTGFTGTPSAVFNVTSTVGTIIQDFQIDCNGLVTTGIYATDINENSWLPMCE